MSRSGIVAVALLFLLPVIGGGQGVATTGIEGRITSRAAENIDARVEITDRSNGTRVSVRTSSGRFLALGLDPGGTYDVVVKSIGFVAEQRTGIVLSLGDVTQVRFALERVPVTLDTLKIVAADRLTENSDGGISTTITPSLLERLPTLDRDVYDFLRLVPQVSAKIGLANPGISAAGIGFRYNNFLIDGVSERTPSGGVSHAFAGNASIPLDAVEEYQVLIAPYDVRYGDFAGALVNTVTKSGTNDLRGSVFAYTRNDHLERQTDPADQSPYQTQHYGLSAGGPIIRDRLHFFVASELQHSMTQADGPYLGESVSAQRAVPVSSTDLDRFAADMRTYGLSAGSSGMVENANPLHSLFTRLDLALPSWNSRLIAWSNYSSSVDNSFSRAAPDTFSFSSYQDTRVTRSRSTALDFHTTLPRASGGHNELLISYRDDAQDSYGPVDQPIIRVSVPGIAGGSVTLNSGTHESAQGLWTAASARAIKDNLTLPVGDKHTLTFGSEAEHFALRKGGAVGNYGTWNFSSLQNFELGIADTYEAPINFGNNQVPLHGTQYSAYTGDEWRITDGLSITTGIRGDLLVLRERAPYNALVDTIFGRRTDEMPRQRVQLSPRLGFVWTPGDENRQRLRGGVGVFTGRYPLAWAQSAVSSYGVGGLLRCSRLRAGAPLPPQFNPDASAHPTACAGGSTITTASPGDVDLLDRNLRLMSVLRGSLAYDIRLPGNVTFSNEGVATRSLSDFAFVNLNLAQPTITDPYGRVMYGTITSTGVAAPNRLSSFTEVIDLRNTAQTHTYQLSTRVERTAETGFGGMISYTYSRARDAETALRVNTRGTAAWAVARVNSGRQDLLNSSISSNDIPQRVVVGGTYNAPWSRAHTSVSFYYVGESGRPFTYVAYGASGRGDLNADGSNANDPIYVPGSAFDSLEIKFSGVSDSVGADNSSAAQSGRVQQQQKAFDKFIESTSCLRRQRGRILERNSCREPWSNTTIASLRQAMPIGGRSLEAQFDLFNVLNLLNRNWGLVRQASPALLEHVGENIESPTVSRPVFRFHDANTAWVTVPDQSGFQMQFSLRYRF